MCSGKASATKDIRGALKLEDADDESNTVKNAEDNTDKIQVGEYVVISRHDNEVPGRITKCLRRGKLMVSLMESSAKPTGWKWPKKPKIYSSNIRDITKHLDGPELIEGDGLVFRFEGI